MSIYSKHGSGRTKQSLLKGLLSAAAAVLLAAIVAVPTANAAVSDHAVKTVDPSSTKVNVFDYWISDSSKTSTITGMTGINATYSGSTATARDFLFSGGAATGVNRWSGFSGGAVSFVSNTLGADGYPQINGGTYTVNDTTADIATQSLQYLFSTDSSATGTGDNYVAGKAVYADATGLFQLQDGYYVYDSMKNYAELNTTTNKFTVYDSAGVYKGSTKKASMLGQFFPFNSASSVFTESGGSLVAREIYDSSTSLNHHFGVSMETNFVQPVNGMVSDNTAMTYEFSGDDDVWVYIDDVLVGDLGGVHEKCTLKIDFSTGSVKIGYISSQNDTYADEVTTTETTLLQLFTDAGADTASFTGNTFNSNSKHTLKFFYLERGAGASNMSLKFNLQDTPQSEVSKTDQNGNAVEGATFELYSADENWKYNYDGDPLAVGTTDENGKLTLVRNKESDPYIINFDTQAENGFTRWILKETNIPAGYRSGLAESDGVMYLQYVAAKSSTSTGGVLVPANNTDSGLSRLWTDGTSVGTNETITASADIKDSSGNSVDITSGVTFSIVVKKGSDGKWYPVTGNSVDGFELTADTGVTGAAEAAKAYSATLYTKNTQGYYTVTLSDMPGDIQKYAFMMSDKTQAEADYTVITYHSSATSLDGVTEGNTVRVEDSGFTRQFSVSLNIANVQNRLWVQKVNEDGKAVNGATFGLYGTDAVTVAADGTVTLREGATPLVTATTADLTSPYAISGAAEFASDGATYLLTGKTYYLAEVSAPAGYELNTTVSKVIVDKTGVYVDAGNDTDGVDSVASVGSLLPTLGQYATNDVIDNTLYKVLATNQTATLTADGKLEWGATSGSSIALHYAGSATGGFGNGSVVLQYAADDGSEPVVVATSGINRAKVTQNGMPTNGTDLGELQLNQLFTNFTAVRYTNNHKSVDYSSKGGVKLTSTLTGHDMAAGQYAYTINADQETATKLGLDTTAEHYAVAAANDGVADNIDLFSGKNVKFTAADAGTYSFSVTQTTKPADGTGYTNDTETRNVTIVVSVDDATGSLSVTTTVKKGEETVVEETVTSEDTEAKRAVVPFAMSYAASGKLGGDGSVAISASKTLTGRAATAGEFSFTLRDIKNNEVSSATNVASEDGAAGAVSFAEIDYDIDSLKTAVQYGLATKTYAEDTNNAVYTMTYTASENTVNGEGASVLPENVTANASSFTITVTVTDNGDGTLTPAVTYPEGTSSLAFTNTYGVAKVTLSGAKEITAADGLKPPTLKDVAGKFTFTLSSDEGAPMPESTNTTNGETGNVAFGEITYLSSDMEGATESEGGTRTKDFYYTITESNTGDAVPGITNDSGTHQVKVHVEENLTTGAMSATATPVVAEGETWTHAGEVFHFVNTYSVVPTDSVPTDPSGDDGKGGISVTKTLTGRTLKEGEFGFSLLQHNEETGEDEAVSYGTNAADGSVSLSAVNFSAPGTYSYKLVEVVPEETKGVTYSDAVYNVKATVADNGNGTLSVNWQIVDENGKALDGDAAKKATFENAYSASMVDGDAAVVVAKKVLEGAQLTNGQFSFELADSEGNVVRTAKNDAEGNVTFDGFTYTFDQMVDDEDNHVTVKDFNYVVSEVNDGQKNVTYDESKQGVTVRVTDDGEGTLTAEVVNGEGSGDIDGDSAEGGDGDVASVPTFTNTYKEEEKPVTPDTPDTPAEPEKELPQTGDTNSMTPVVVAAVAGVALIVVAVVLMKRKK